VLSAASNPDLVAPSEDTLSRARELKGKGQWAAACDQYDDYLRQIRNAPEAREEYRECLRHLNQQRRFRDEDFCGKIVSLDAGTALDIYEEVLVKLRSWYVDRDKVDLAVLFQNGLQELRFALEDEDFRRHYLANASHESIQSFKTWLKNYQPSLESIETETEARHEVENVAVTARSRLKLPFSVVVLEFAWGACSALDEYTRGLSPRQFADLQANLEGKAIGIGVKLRMDGSQFFVQKVSPDSPAQGRLSVGDRIQAIDGQALTSLSLETVTALLLGEEGSAVELELAATMADAPARVVKIQRGSTMVRSVGDPFLDANGIGYVRIFRFQKNTTLEMKSALLNLQSRGMKVLILDLRGNPGGSVEGGREVAELFLSNGVIVHTQDRAGEQSYKANNPRALSMPLIVLVDGDTASTAELLAGALKENERATLVGQNTFGKGTIQAYFPLERFRTRLPAGLRITIRTFLSPLHNPYSGKGVAPHQAVEAGDMGDAQLDAALAVALDRLAHLPTMPPVLMIDG
jgi:carboxyl-terminal processing protease